MVKNTEANQAMKNAIRGSSLGKTYVRSEFLTEAPKFTSINQIKEQNRQNARKSCNLTDQIHEQKDEVKPPGLAYVQNPKIAAQAQLKEQRREQMLQDLKKNEVNFATHQDAQARINAREDCNLRKLAVLPPSKTTLRDIKDKRRGEMIMENVNKFGEQTIGIHGQELPKYSQFEQSKEWWKYATNGKDAPKV